MKYLKKYISDVEIKQIRDQYNEGIIEFMEDNEKFIEEKLEYLKEEGYIIYPIIENNIKIFLEIMPELIKKIEKMQSKNFNKKQIQMILMDENLYNKI